ncbi:MAG: geopeptide radical SAM maturase [Thermodesulfobacteriota bacterium]
MHLSHYLKNFPLDTSSGLTVLYSTKNGALVVVEDADFVALKSGSFDGEIVPQLAELGFVVDDLEAEQQEVFSFVDQINKRCSGLYLDIILGMACNFACSYCYEGSLKADKSSMSADTAAQLLKYVEGQFEDRDKLSITFYGGEPLLYVPLIRQLCQGFQEMTAQREREFEFSLITNGSLLTSETVKSLIPYGLVGAKITLDGPPDLHNNSRPYISGKPSFAVILENLRSCADLITLSLGGNFTEHIYNRFPELLDILAEKDLGPDHLHQVRFASVMQQTDDVAESSYRQGCETLTETWLVQAQSMLREKILAAGYYYPEEKPNPCKVLRHDSLTINYDGTLCKCPVLIGRPDYEIGDIWNGVKEISMYHTDNWQYENKCRSCQYLPLCFGGCRYLALVRDGNMEKVDCLKGSFDNTLENFILQDIKYRYGESE